MKKISIDKKYYFNFVNLPPEEVKNIILSLLGENMQNLTEGSKMLAQIIYNDNSSISSLRKETAEKRWKSYPQKSYPHSMQTMQNMQTLPPTSPNSRLINNKNNIINQEAPTTARDSQEKGKNCFSPHSDFCSRVPVRTEEERKPFLDMFTVIMHEIQYHEKYKDAMLEIIDTIIEMYDKVNADKRFRFGKIYIYKEDINRLVLDLTYDEIEPLLKQLAYRNPDDVMYKFTKGKPAEIKNHPYYILTGLLKNSSKGEKAWVKNLTEKCLNN